MDLISEIVEGFYLSDGVIISDGFIRLNDDLMSLKEKMDPMIYVPSYMVWCIENQNLVDSLVIDYTINALAEYGRSKTKTKTGSHLSFKFDCSVKQIGLIIKFLNWSIKTFEYCDKQQIERSIKQWEKAANKVINKDIKS